MTRIASIARGARKLVVDNSPAILTGLAVAGVVSTAILAGKATPRALQEISEAESEQTEPLSVNQKIFLVGHCYLPAIVSGAFTISCLIMAQSINAKRYAAMMSALNLSEIAHKEYQQKVTETLGVNKEQKVRDEVAQDRVNNHPVSDREVIITGNGNVLCYDSYSDRYFESEMQTLRKSENEINFQIIHEMYASLNDFYSAIGLAQIPVGDEVGWTNDRKFDLKITTTLSKDDKPCLTMSFGATPIRGFHKFG